MDKEQQRKELRNKIKQKQQQRTKRSCNDKNVYNVTPVPNDEIAPVIDKIPETISTDEMPPLENF